MTTRGPSNSVRQVTTPVRRKPSLDFSLTGLVYCSMMMFMGLAAINSQANLLFGVFGLMIGVLVISGFISRLVLRRLRVQREIPEAVMVGEVTVIAYSFTNHKRFWPSLSVGLSELDGVEAFTKQPSSYLLHAAGGMTASVPTEVVPKRRGLHELNRYQISTSFPFGFIKRALERRHADTLVVYPPIGKVDPKVLQMARSAEKTGATMRPRRGGEDEFYGLKEYRQGENPRMIYWKRSARTGTLVSKEMTQVSPPRLVLLVDTFLQDRSEAEHVRVERAIAMAASTASAALAQDISVGLCAWDGAWVAIPPTRGKRQLRDILTTLARLSLNTSRNTQHLLDESRDIVGHGTTAVLFTPRDMQIGLSERTRGSMMVFSSAEMGGRQMFRFGDEIDFATCMPFDQQPKISGH
ncbi:MAG TPA: DUF58 domain-containing protein [Tepidisphaeraceae bacterium]|jgi:uncharacterized protein (DUF58 family)|nr:DUF58 domain-containing protein [Tepidisphaeraceae bacterium]